MPGTGTKQKKTPPPAAPAPVVITITNGDANPDEVTVKPGTSIIFVNQDSVTYDIEMTTNGNATPVGVLLPALTSVTVVAGAITGKKTVDYTLTVMVALSNVGGVQNEAGGGGGRIIISS